MRWLGLLLAMMVSPCGLSQTQSPVRLKPDQPLTVTGTLTMRPFGRLQFVTVKTAQVYVPVFPGYGDVKEHEGKPVHEIALKNYDSYALLYAHRGDRVTVTGKAWTNVASPYYRDGMVLMAEHIRTRGGTELIGSAAKGGPVAADIGLYRATAILPADQAAPWRYTVNGKPDPRGMLSCSSNGSGDVVNCFCTDGFHPVRPTVTIRGKTRRGQVYAAMPDMAQFGMGEDEQPPLVKINLTCER